MGDFCFHFVDRAIGFTQQHCSGFQIIAGLGKGLDQPRGGLVHHLKACGNDARGDQCSDGIAGIADVGKAGHEAAGHGGPRHQPHRDLGREGEHTLGADHQCQQVQAWCIGGQAAELHRFAGRSVAAHAQHVVQGQAVLEAMHATGVLGDVAADGAGNLAGGIGRVVQPERGRRLGDGQVAHARLHGGRAATTVDTQDAVELGHREQHAAGMGQGTAGQASARAPRHHRHLVRMAELEDGHHLRLGLGQRHSHGPLADQREAITLIGTGVFGRHQQRPRGQQAAQAVNDLGA